MASTLPVTICVLLDGLMLTGCGVTASDGANPNKTDAQRFANLQKHVDAQVTMMQVEITEGKTVAELVGKKTFSDGETVNITADADNTNYTVTGTDPQSKYKYVYDSATGTFTTK